MTKLDPRPARTNLNLTSRECSILIGGFLGALVQITEVETIKIAMRWWQETPEAWDQLEAVKTLLGQQETYDENPFIKQ